ncbi:hypothetical protein V1511DRAFT_489174 [Dipodascopsis uninucleata]
MTSARGSSIYKRLNHYVDLSNAWKYEFRENAVSENTLNRSTTDEASINHAIQYFQHAIKGIKELLDINNVERGLQTTAMKANEIEKIAAAKDASRFTDVDLTPAVVSRLQSSSAQSIAILKEAIIKQQEELRREQDIYDELTRFKDRMDETRGALIEHEREQHTAKQIAERRINQLAGRRDEARTMLKHLMTGLKSILDSDIADILVDETKGAAVGGFIDKQGRTSAQGTDQDEAAALALKSSIARDCKQIIENLLNAAFEESKTGGYIRVDDPDGVIIRLLLRADIILMKKNDSRYVKLRHFSKSFD